MTMNFKKYKVVFRHDKPLTKVVLIVILALCIGTTFVIRNKISAERARLESNRAAAIRQEQQGDEIRGKIDLLGSQEGIKQIAGDELGLHDPDTIIVDTE